MGNSRSRCLLGSLAALLALCQGNLNQVMAQNQGDDDEPNVPICINEIMASNSSAVPVPQTQRYEDWIELWNESDSPVDVGGLYLTNDFDVPTQWQIPTNKPTATTIPAKGFLVIWADAGGTGAGLHANFRLDADGDALYLFESDGRTLIDSIEFGPQSPNVSFGRYPDGTGEWQFLSDFTPAAPNKQTYEGMVGDIEISPEHGFYDQAFSVIIACRTPDATIYYTTDGSEPAKEGGRSLTGHVYSGPIQISKTACLRARAVEKGWRPSPIVTQTYIFIDQVTRQSAGAAGFPATWGGATADYTMDSRIVTPNLQQIKQGLTSIPTMSLVMRADDLFGSTNGIYSHATSRGTAYERPASLELIWPDSSKGSHANCGIRMEGDVGRQDPYRKKSFRLLFKGIYGQTSLQYPLFGDAAAQQFNQLVLRAQFNDGYVYGREKSQYLRDEYSRRLGIALGCVQPHGIYVHLYINGVYWGLYNPVERPDASFAASYFGGDKQDWDSFHVTAPTGDSVGDSWGAMLNAVRQGVQTNEGYQRVQGNNPDGTRNPNYKDYIDVDDYIDYLIVNFFVGNTDWPHKNWFAAMNRVDTSGFKFFSWDTEWVMDLVLGSGLDSSLTENVVGVTNGIAEPYGQLRNNADFRMLFADHIRRAFFDGGPLYADPSRPQWDAAHPEQNRAAASYAELAASIELPMLDESARWGDVATGGTPYTITQWRAERDYILNTYMVQRPGIVLGQFRNAGLYPAIDAPVFRINGSYQHGGYIPTGAALSMTAADTIWYTLDGIDPRLPATVPAQTTGTNTLVREDAPKRVLVPTSDIGQAWKSGQPFDDSTWISGTGGVGYERSTGYETYFRINVGDAMYGKNSSCYIRIPFTLTRAGLQNISKLTLRVRYDDGFVAYVNGTEVQRALADGTPTWNSGASGSHLDSDAIVFEDFDISGYLNALREGDNLLAIQALNQGTTSSDFLLSVELTATPKGGSSNPSGVAPTAIQYASPATLTKSIWVKARVLSGTTWSALNEAVFAVGPVAESLRISEIMYHPANTGNPDDPNTEFIELTNIGSAKINLNLVKFSNGVDFTFPSFDLAPNAYCLVVKDAAAFAAKYGSGLPVVGQYAGSLSNAGERIELLDAAGAVIHDFHYEDNWFDITDGLGFSLTVRSPQTTDPNSYGSKGAWRPSAHAGGSPGTDDSGQVPVLGSVVINELLANSQGSGPDWIELYNTTTATIDIGGWFLSDDANDLTKYRIADGTSIPGGGYKVFYEDKHFGNSSDPGCKKPFALSRTGETVYLHSGSAGVMTGYSEQEKFDASEAGVTLGRYQKSTGTYNFVALSKATPGAANAAPQVGPVVINEIMYHPDAPADAEYVELVNISSQPVTLYDADRELPWRFTDNPENPSIELLFPTDPPVTLAAGEYLLLVKDVAMFSSKYTAPAGGKILAWGIGNLADGGEKIELSKPADPDGKGNPTWIRVDRVVYSDGSHPGDFPEGVDPWPVQPDGHGYSLSRTGPGTYGNDPDNWRASDPSPGRANP